jgi:hypothetical protein
VNGPNNFSNAVSFSGVDTTTDGTPCTASYSINAPNGLWNAADNGSYTIVLQDGEVSDIYNNFMGGTVLGTFSVNIPNSPQALIVQPTLLNIIEGSNALFTVRLAQPITNSLTVNIAPLNGDPDLVILSNAVIVFDASSWSNATPVTIAALPDADTNNGSAIFECHASNLQAVTVLATESDTTSTAILMITVNHSGWGIVTPNSGTFPAGTTIQVLASPAPYFRFVEWIGDYTSTNDPLVLVLTTNVSIEAVFAEVVTTNHPTPLWWLAARGYTNDFENAVTQIGINGMPLWQSYIAGLDPTDPNSQLTLQLQHDTGPDWILNWNTVSNRVYTVLTRTNPLDGFTPLPEATQLPWTINTVTNVSAEPTRFYRLEVFKP